MIGPLSAVLIAVFILDDAMNLWIVAGTVLVLMGVGLLARCRANAVEGDVVNVREA